MKIRLETKDYNVLIFFVFILYVLFYYFAISRLFDPISSVDNKIYLDISYLPKYTFYTTARLCFSMILSLIIAIVWGSIAAKNPRARKILLPLIDIFQSVPILGFISFTVVFFVSLSKKTIFGIEFAIVFALITSLLWNMILSVYQSLTNMPNDLHEVAKIYKLNKWRIFWQIEIPFLIPALLWNMMLSFSAGLFFIAASEAITVGKITYIMPGIGSYIAKALIDGNIPALIASIFSILFIIYILNHLFFLPLIAWSEKFKYDFSATQESTNSWVFLALQRSNFFNTIISFIETLFSIILKLHIRKNILTPIIILLEILFWIIICYSLVKICIYINIIWKNNINISEILYVIKLGFYSLVRIFIMTFLASIILVPIGMIIGSKASLAKKSVPLVQLLTAFPANIYFPLFAFLIAQYNLNPNIILSVLMIVGVQWYILFNIIAGARSIPNELIEASNSLKLSSVQKWKKLFIPSLLPYYMTGLMTASGGAWNASIVSEIIVWGNTTYKASGIGTYIVESTISGNFAHISLGIIVTTIYVIIIEHILWQPLCNYISKKYSLDGAV